MRERSTIVVMGIVTIINTSGRSRGRPGGWKIPGSLITMQFVRVAHNEYNHGPDHSLDPSLENTTLLSKATEIMLKCNRSPCTKILTN